MLALTGVLEFEICGGSEAWGFEADEKHGWPEVGEKSGAVCESLVFGDAFEGIGWEPNDVTPSASS
jgi:hypothetical protein